MARKNGCPTNIRDWQVDILNRATTIENPTWIRIKGLDSLDYSIEGDTEDGSAADQLWSEPYVSKRNGSFTLEGKPVVDQASGAQDPGQAELDYYATVGGCEGDATLRLADAYGHKTIMNVVVTSSGRSADDSSETRSWDMEIVGEPSEEAYVQATGIAVKVGSDTASSTATASVAVGATQACAVVFTPTDSSNQRYRIGSADTSKAKVANIDGLNFDIIGVAATTSVVINVRSINNNRTATVTVTVTGS